VLADGERRSDEDARAPFERELHETATELGAGGGEARDHGSRELREGGIALDELVVDGESVIVDADDAAALEVAEDAGAGDLQDIGHVSGRKTRERTEHEPPFSRRRVHPVEEDDVQVRIQLEVRRCALHHDDSAALGALKRGRTQSTAVPAEHGIGEDAGDGAEELAVETEAAAKFERKRQYPLPERHGREHVLEKVCRRLAHSTPQAGWAEAAAFTRERDQMLLGARITLHPREAAAEQSAVEVALELAAHEHRQRRALEPRRNGGIQRLDVIANHRVQRRRLRPAALVAWGAGRAERNRGKAHGARVGRAVCRASGPLPALEIEHEAWQSHGSPMASANSI